MQTQPQLWEVFLYGTIAAGLKGRRSDVRWRFVALATDGPGALAIARHEALHIDPSWKDRPVMGSAYSVKPAGSVLCIE